MRGIFHSVSCADLTISSPHLAGISSVLGAVSFIRKIYNIRPVGIRLDRSTLFI